jgi:hypothetical protein
MTMTRTGGPSQWSLDVHCAGAPTSSPRSWPPTKASDKEPPRVGRHEKLLDERCGHSIAARPTLKGAVPSSFSRVLWRLDMPLNSAGSCWEREMPGARRIRLLLLLVAEIVLGALLGKKNDAAGEEEPYENANVAVATAADASASFDVLVNAPTSSGGLCPERRPFGARCTGTGAAVEHSF